MSALATFRHATPAFRVYAGDDSLRHLRAEVERAGCRRAVVVCGRTVARESRVLPLVQGALGDICAGVFDGVQAHSPLPAVLAATEALREMKADAVIAVGGGSAVVTARAAAILLAEGVDIRSVVTQYPPGKPPVSPKLNAPKLPQFIVPTTPTTAYAKAGSAVVDPAVAQRLALFDPKTRAVALFIHPEAALSAPTRLAASAALNAFAMAVEGLQSRARDPLADALLLHALRLLREYLPRLETEPGNAEIRVGLMVGALLAGQGTDYTGSGLNAALTHPIGARFHAENGIVNAVLLPWTMRFNTPVAGERLALVAEALGAATRDVDAAINAVEALFARLGVPRRLRDVGVAEDAIPQIASDAAEDFFFHQNPRRIEDPGEVVGLLRSAW